MLMVGLTGGIASGKSAVARRLAELGAIVIDSDALAREVVAPGSEGLAEVVEAFGPRAVTEKGEMDRAAIAEIVFGDEEKRKRLEGVIHPRVRARSAEIVAAAPPDAVVVNDVPLLVEANLASHYDLVIVVLADEGVRLDRLVRLRGMTEETARARFAAQATDEQRRAVADVVIENDGTLAELQAKVDTVWRERIEPQRAARGGR